MIEDGALVGMGAIVLQRARVGARAMLAAGAVVGEARAAGMLAAGVPAREKKPLSGSAQAWTADRGRPIPGLPPALPDNERRDRRELTVEAAMLIGGEWRQAAASEEIEVVNPATEEVVGSVPSADAADVELAVATAKRAFPEWAATDAEKRAHILAKAADAHRRARQGPRRAADLRAGQADRRGARRGHPPRPRRALLRRGGDQGARRLPGAAVHVRARLRPWSSAARWASARRSRPYNFPLTLLGTKVAPALASGNTVVAKPAATTPLATLEVARLFAEAGVPDGVLNVVTGRGSDIGDALVGHPDVRRVAFTGSTEVGRHVVVDRRAAAQAASRSSSAARTR